MRNFFRFHWLCVKEAWRGSWSAANQLSTFLGGAILTVILYKLRPWLESQGLRAPTTIPGTVAFNLVLAATSFIVAFLVIFAARLPFASATIYWRKDKQSEDLQAELALSKDGVDLGPNWSIHELFFYLEPEALDRPQDKLWQKAGDEIRDALSLGRLRIWGRPSKTKLGDWIGERAALRPIEKAYWEKAFFTYTFFDASARDTTHCYSDRDTGRPAYTDLQVNRAEVLKLWPGEPNDIAEDYANVRVADSPEIIELFNGPERTKLIGLLEAGRLTTWARVSASVGCDLVLVEGDIWHTHSFRFMPRTDRDSGTINQTYLRPRGGHNSTHHDVCLNFAQLKRAWPGLQIRRSACDVR